MFIPVENGRGPTWSQSACPIWILCRTLHCKYPSWWVRENVSKGRSWVSAWLVSMAWADPSPSQAQSMCSNASAQILTGIEFFFLAAGTVCSALRTVLISNWLQREQLIVHSLFFLGFISLSLSPFHYCYCCYYYHLYYYISLCFNYHCYYLNLWVLSFLSWFSSPSHCQ